MHMIPGYRNTNEEPLEDYKYDSISVNYETWDERVLQILCVLLPCEVVEHVLRYCPKDTKEYQYIRSLPVKEDITAVCVDELSQRITAVSQNNFYVWQSGQLSDNPIILPFVTPYKISNLIKCTDNNSYIASSAQGTLEKWSIDEEHSISIKELEFDLNNYSLSSIFSILMFSLSTNHNKNDTSNNNVLICGHRKGDISIWDHYNGHCLYISKTAHYDDITKLEIFNYRGIYYLCTASNDRSIKIWNISYCNQQYNLILTRTLRGHANYVSDLAISGSKYPILVSSSWDRTVRVWNLGLDGDNDAKCVHIIAHKECVGSVIFLNSEIIVASTLEPYGTLYQCNVKSGRIIHIAKTRHNDYINGLYLSYLGSLVVYSPKKLSLYDVLE